MPHNYNLRSTHAAPAAPAAPESLFFNETSRTCANPLPRSARRPSSCGRRRPRRRRSRRRRNRCGGCTRQTKRVSSSTSLFGTRVLRIRQARGALHTSAGIEHQLCGRRVPCPALPLFPVPVLPPVPVLVWGQFRMDLGVIRHRS